MQVLVAMSGGVDSAVAASLMVEAGHEVVGVTMKLWGGPSDTGCCAISDVVDARRAADLLGVDHHVFNFGEDFERDVVAPYVEAHTLGLTPNPCIECNRSIKFSRLLERADQLGFDRVVTGHHARIVEHEGARFVARGADHAKDQSYVLHTLRQPELARLDFPIGAMDKTEVRSRAAEFGMRLADKPDSQDVCFITRVDGRENFLRERVSLTPGTVVDASGATVGSVDAVEMVTIGQRKGLNLGGFAEPHYAVSVDVSEAVVTVGRRQDLYADRVPLIDLAWAAEPEPDAALHAQTSAHGTPFAATLHQREDKIELIWDEPQRRVAPGQSVVLYSGDRVVAGALATRPDVIAPSPTAADL